MREEVGSLLNAGLMLVVMVPPILFVWRLQKCSSADGAVCNFYLQKPALFVNAVYFVVVDVGFWLISVAQGSTWLIDPHWQLIPLCVAAFYASHPRCERSPRGLAALFLLCAWAVRLLWNYARRERFRWGEREDWRYADMRAADSRFWLVSFLVVGVAQHPMLCGLTLPLLACLIPTTSAAGHAPLAALDACGFGCCVLGLAIAWRADEELWRYARLARRPLVLDTGLWACSRHPNHFGEQLWWIGFALVGVAACGSWWPFLGVAYNHPIDTFATLGLIEDRMLKRPERTELYRAYQRRTSFLLPWPPAKIHDA